MIGYRDTVYYDYETKDNYCWVIEYNGTWDEYILFGRVFLFCFGIKFNLTVIERIQLNCINEDGKELFFIKIYLPIP
ncbi:hypothetical protein ESOG_04690 [Escherichia coli E101]|nr:hypothetical protein ESOG_04690 [Escherichia coli E101]